MMLFRMAVAMATIGVLFWSGSSHAQDWNVLPAIQLGVGYDDNLRLDGDGPSQGDEDEDATGASLEVGARIWRTTPTGTFNLRPRIRTSKYDSKNSDADSTDLFLDSLLRNDGQTTGWSLELRFSDEEVLRAELDDPDFDNPEIDEPIVDDTGRVRVENQRQRIVVVPKYYWDFSQQTRFDIGAVLTDVSYDNNSVGLRDYTNGRLEVGATRQVTEQNTLRGSVFGAQYDSDGVSGETTSVGVELQLTRQLSPRNRIFGAIGYQRIEFDQVGNDESEGAALIRAGFTREYQISRLVLDAQRTVLPSGFGQVRERDQFRARFTRPLSQLTTLELTARVQRTSDVSDVAADNDREFGRLQIDIERQLTRSWSIVGELRHTRQEFENESETESSNSVFVGIRYEPPRPN